VSFVSEAVAALGDVRVAVGIATGPASVVIEVLPPSPAFQVAVPAPSAGVFCTTAAAVDAAGDLCWYTVSGPAAEAAKRLERDGLPGFMHLSLEAADRLGAERGLFLDLTNAEVDTAPTGPSMEGIVAAPASSVAVARRRSNAADVGRGLRHSRSVWIDCFHADRLLSADDLAAVAAGGGGVLGAAKEAGSATFSSSDAAGGLAGRVAALLGEDSAETYMHS
jgi:hypothetical protein